MASEPSSSSESFSIEPAESLTDVQYTLRLALKEEWNQIEYDFMICKLLSPDKYFIAKLDGRNIGCLVVVMVNPNHAFIHGFIIEEGYRGRGYGGRLFDTALASLRPGCSASLDAVESVCPYYEQRGFKRFWTSHVYDCSLTTVYKYY